MNLHEQLKQRAKELGITQEEVSFQVGVHNANFWDSIKKEKVKFKHLKEVCRILKIDLTLTKLKK